MKNLCEQLPTVCSPVGGVLVVLTVLLVLGELTLRARQAIRRRRGGSAVVPVAPMEEPTWPRDDAVALALSCLHAEPVVFESKEKTAAFLAQLGALGYEVVRIGEERNR